MIDALHESVAAIDGAAEALRAEHERCDIAGRLTPATVDILRASGGVRLLQAADHSGYEADPRIFLQWVRTVARYNPSAGWVAGVVGVHPWEIALVDERLQDEIYGTDPDIWTASPYAPQGRAVPTDDGYLFNGRWSYSTGTDHCDWIILGGIVVDPDPRPGSAPDVRHFILPRGDYEIVDDSWHVMGLAGTGSKDIRIADRFVPAYRTVSHRGLADGEYAHLRPDSALYQLPFGCVFSAAVASASLGMAQGLIDGYRRYLESRVSAMGVVGARDPFQLEALAELEADVAAGIAHLDTMLGRWLDRVADGDRLTRADRLEFRRNQVRAVQRVVTSADKLMGRAGSAAIWTTQPLERFWRDLRTGATHVCNVTETIYTGWGGHAFGSTDPIRAFH